MRKRILPVIVLFFAALVIDSAVQAQTAATPQPTPVRPTPDIADGKYGTLPANTFDLWKASSTRPTPLLVYIHGGGLNSGNKTEMSVNLLNEMLKAGITVMSINYRLTADGAVYPQHYMDSARAIQFARANAKEFNIDPKRVAAAGSSAGGMTSLWIGFHDDMADKKSADPVLRQSTRLRVMAVTAAQSTLVPDVVTKYVGPLALQYQTYFNGKMFGLTPEEARSPRGIEMYKAISPMTYLTKDDPPVWAYYSIPNTPLTSESTVSAAIHHPGFGVALKEAMDKLGIECKLRHKDDGLKVNEDMIRFLLKYL